MIYLVTPEHSNPITGGHEMYNFSRPFLSHSYRIIRRSKLRLGVENKIFKEIHQVYTYYYRIGF